MTKLNVWCGAPGDTVRRYLELRLLFWLLDRDQDSRRIGEVGKSPDCEFNLQKNQTHLHHSPVQSKLILHPTRRNQPRLLGAVRSCSWMPLLPLFNLVRIWSPTQENVVLLNSEKIVNVFAWKLNLNCTTTKETTIWLQFCLNILIALVACFAFHHFLYSIPPEFQNTYFTSGNNYWLFWKCKISSKIQCTEDWIPQIWNARFSQNERPSLSRRLRMRTNWRGWRSENTESKNMAYQTFQQEYLQMPPITRAYTTACVLTTVAVVSLWFCSLCKLQNVGAIIWENEPVKPTNVYVVCFLSSLLSRSLLREKNWRQNIDTTADTSCKRNIHPCFPMSLVFQLEQLGNRIPPPIFEPKCARC